MQFMFYGRFSLLWLFVLLTVSCPVFAERESVIDSKIATLKSQYGVQVHYVYDAEDYFPAHWLRAPISAQGQSLPLGEVERLLPIIAEFLAQYPTQVLRNDLADIYLVSKLMFYGKSYGATNSPSGLYIKSEGIEQGFTNAFLLRTLHSEFSSILMRNHPFPDQAWRMVNAPQFKYRGNGRMMLDEADLYSQNRALLSQGFIVKYAQGSLEEDFNMIVYSLFTNGQRLKQLAHQYPRIKAKVLLAINFYESIDSGFEFEGF